MSADTVSTTAPAGHRPAQIADRIVDAILAGRLRPGQRLGEQALAELFGVGRALVRDALARLSSRGMVQVNARRGWFVVQPSPAEVHEAFGARLAIETGLLLGLTHTLPQAALARLQDHVAREQALLDGQDPVRGAAGGTDTGHGPRSALLADFHVCLADCAGNALLGEILKDLTARTTLMATLYQSTLAAAQSCAEHGLIVQALADGDSARAAELMRSHLANVAGHLGQAAGQHDRLAPLRAALSPDPASPARSPPGRRRSGLFTRLLPAARPSSKATQASPGAPATPSPTETPP